jgi:hypothetical protein
MRHRAALKITPTSETGEAVAVSHKNAQSGGFHLQTVSKAL